MSHRQRPNPAETYGPYLGPAIADPGTRVLLEYAAPQPGERALDVACGTGSVARHIAPIVGTHGKVVALDISPAMLAVAREGSGQFDVKIYAKPQVLILQRR